MGKERGSGWGEREDHEEVIEVEKKQRKKGTQRKRNRWIVKQNEVCMIKE